MGGGGKGQEKRREFMDDKTVPGSESNFFIHFL